jgi:hypothetical protein
MAADRSTSERPAPPSDRLRRALQLLAEEARERVERHPLGHLLGGRGDVLELRLALPSALRPGVLDKVAAEAAEALQEALQGLLEHRAVLRPGRVVCLRCGGADCGHAAPAAPRQVFAGYGPTGLPRFLDLGAWLLERHDPRVDLLYRQPPPLLAAVATGAELAAGLLPPYRADTAGSFRLHGQVAAGWYAGPGAGGAPEALAVTLQLVSSRPARGPRRYGVNVLGLGPQGEPLEHLWDRIGEIPWGDAVRWAQAALDGLARSRAAQADDDAEVAARLDGILHGLARRLEKGRRARERKTRHARERHAGGDRPTRMALADLARAPLAEVLVDTRSAVLVVLGDRGRAHLFSPEGRLVTSIRYAPAAIERRRKSGLWRPADRSEVELLRARVEGAAALEREPAAG